jgi:hypothetical protein
VKRAGGDHPSRFAVRFRLLYAGWPGYEAVATTALALGSLVGVMTEWLGIAPLWISWPIGFVGICMLAAAAQDVDAEKSRG